MTRALAAELDCPLERRIGKSSADPIRKHLGLTTVGELLNHFPRRYLRRGELTPISEVPLDEDVTLVARVLSANTRKMHTRRGSLTEITVTDDSGAGYGYLHLTFFNGVKKAKELRVGSRAMFSGRVNIYRGKLTLTNPNFVLLDEDSPETSELAARPIPIYPATAKLSSWDIQKAAHALLDIIDLAGLVDPLPESILARETLLPIQQAYRQIHRPDTPEAAEQARHRFRYQEALVLQTSLARRRARTAQEEATARPPVSGGLLDQFDQRLPFTLTAGQDDIGRTLRAELSEARPMNRLLQGEVGSGKTLVALRAMLQVIDSGGQAALLAPTEVLAAQHHQSITRILGPLAEGGMLGGAETGTRVVLLTGSMPSAVRRSALLDAASGDAGIVIGTHALLSDNVQFFDLGLVVVDEQHRFGVEQRDALRSKAARPPHLLVMTATPIPRTVAMTVFGDLETSTLAELPAGRAPIRTHVVGLAEHPGWLDRTWARAREEIDAGRQVYVVCPKISSGGSAANDDDDAADTPRDVPQDGLKDGLEDGRQERPPLTSVTSLAEELPAVPQLQGVRTGVLHGQLDPQAKAAAMSDFAEGRLDLLISTTVIEVGVDVPNATLMVIFDADRFGISQLHQLRGRVGRGGLPGTCLLVTALEPEHPARERLAAVAATTDGFELSREDLRMRREGDILGASQSGGRSTLRLLRVLQDEELIESARADARRIIEEDPDLLRHPELGRALEEYLNPEKEAFLERS